MFSIFSPHKFLLYLCKRNNYANFVVMATWAKKKVNKDVCAVPCLFRINLHCQILNTGFGREKYTERITALVNSLSRNTGMQFDNMV